MIIRYKRLFAKIPDLAEQLRKSEEANAETAKEHQADMKRFQEKVLFYV